MVRQFLFYLQVSKFILIFGLQPIGVKEDRTPLHKIIPLVLSGTEKEGWAKVTALNLGLNRAVCVPGLVTLQKTCRVNCPAPHHKQELCLPQLLQ